MKLSSSRRRLLTISRLLVVAAIVVLLGGLGVSWYVSQLHSDQSPVASETPHETDIATTTLPTTEKPTPDTFAKYTVAPDDPRYLFISKLSIRAMVKPMGVTKDFHIEAPASAFDAGWYKGSAKPGAQGAMLIDGHVSAGAVPGIFAHLEDLSPGDEVRIEKGNGELLTYQVVKTKTYSVSDIDMKEVLSPSTDRPGLNLITCTGNPVKGSNNYDKRLVVYTEQL